MSDKREHYIFIDKKKLMAAEEGASDIYGNIKEMCRRQKILINIRERGKLDVWRMKEIKYDTLYKLLGKDKYFDNEDYYIKRVKLKRSKVINK